MTKFKITYNEADTINKTAIVEASVIFTMENPDAFITNVEVVTND